MGRQRKFSSKVWLVLFVCFGYILLSADSLIVPEKYISVVKLANNKTVKMYAISLGGYSGECINFYLENNSEDSIYTKIEPGTIFLNDNVKEQDILVVRQEQIALKTNMKDSIVLNGYCCRAHRSSPTRNRFFSNLIKANDTLCKLAQFLNKSHFEKSEEQHAVWVVSDHNNLASIGEGEHKQNIELRKFVAKITGKENPWYTIIYNKDTIPFSNHPERVFGEITYQTNSMCLVDIFLFDNKNVKVKALKMGLPVSPGTHTYLFDEKGIFGKDQTYYVKIFYDRAIRVTRKIEL